MSRRKDEPAPTWSGAESLRPLLVQTDRLVEDPKNARRHPDRNLDVVRRSLQDFGQMKPIVSRDGVVVAGNATLRCARDLGWTHVAAVDAAHLTPSQAAAYGLVDNKAGDLAEWDYRIVGELLKELPAELLDATGFADFERTPLMSSDWGNENGGFNLDGTGNQPEKPGGGGPGGGHISGFTFTATSDQAVIIREAIEMVRSEVSGASDGRCLELICADFLSGKREVGEVRQAAE